jgi:hypothetical protein
MGEFWFNVETRSVEEGPQSPGHVRMGPYPTRAAAERAVEHAHERTTAWDDADRAWRGEED